MDEKDLRAIRTRCRRLPLSGLVRQDIETLADEVEKLTEWKKNVPLHALHYIFYDCKIVDAEGYDVIVEKWLHSIAGQE